ncbi:SDR family oxidoreductase [Asanoa sp. WMMD1127]|uniref:SDR family NAD(P)-dependent oxidoreductase n=1 Tax=Asanoa sp. WMMD1127 TaxID=3016107 RepID=UPI0024169653|nr:SDR family oxidoreductase [Asanoa sp. WMMD1127]MDG4822984.1 SDR family oxidoreductase [Asanoa sp. WMMD1127]
MNLTGAVAVVTGGGTGIGRAVARSLAAAGAEVAVTYAHSAAEAKATAAEIGALAVPLNVGDETQVRAAAHRVLRELGRVDVLVNNAARTHAVEHADLDGLTDAMWHEILDVNVVGPYRCVRALAPALRAARGAVVNVSSISAYRAGGSSIAYGVSKAALLQLTRNLAAALAPEVRVNAVAPGTVDTRWQTSLHGESGFATRRAAEEPQIPLGRVATPEHVAQAVLGLLTMDDVTGETIIVDGGKHVRY